ncbi:hypothetical protein LTR74_017423 [Friedmanniomyces endolithicus]|nr:hypothetical protein LTR74_017423 [Friedmanniomyces endolithicus]
MHRNTLELPKALVLTWDSRTLRVKCPYCLYSHGHGFSGLLQGETVDRTQEDTNDAAAQGYGWEVHQARVGFVAVNNHGVVDIPLQDYLDGRTLLPQYLEQQQATFDLDDTESETSSLADVTNGLNLGSNAGEGSPIRASEKTTEEIIEELHLDPAYRQNMYIFYCCQRRVLELQSLCHQYPNDQLIGHVDEKGNTGALLAATEESGLETLRWLQRHGDSISQANHYGRTPLMEAALWGRSDTVQYLTRQGIDLGVQDGNGMRAIDLAEHTGRNAKERRLRSVLYRESPDASMRREQIKNLLERLSPRSTPSSLSIASTAQRRAFFDRKTDGTIEVYRPTVLLQPPGGQQGLQKAFATLDRGPNYPYVNAMSGYTHAGLPNVLDNTVWTEKAETLRAMLGLPKNRRAASHVEPQLLAYLLERHSLHAHADLGGRRELLSVMPTYSIWPIITVSKSEFCPFCQELFVRFRTNFPELGIILQCVGETAMVPFEVLE